MTGGSCSVQYDSDMMSGSVSNGKVRIPTVFPLADSANRNRFVSSTQDYGMVGVRGITISWLCVATPPGDDKTEGPIDLNVAA